MFPGRSRGNRKDRKDRKDRVGRGDSYGDYKNERSSL